jgi:uncharacterized membrane protein YccC
MTNTLRSLAQVDPGIRARAPKLEHTGLRNRLRNFAKGAMPTFNGPVLGAVVFSAKTFAAAILGLFISFWLGLDDPYWVLLTVFIVAQPDSGLVLAKGFYRLLGTAAGVLMTTALVFAFAQYRELFIDSLAAWIGVCSFAARGTRSYASYGFQLAGYTAAVVGIPAALSTNGAYTLIIARSTEICLGIVCMGLVSRLIFPVHLEPKLMALADRLFRRVDRFVEIAIDPTTDRKQLDSERGALAKDFGAFETMRSSAFFESAEARLIDSPLRDAVLAAVDLCAVAEAAAPGRLHSQERSSCSSLTAGAIPASNEVPKTRFALEHADARAVLAARTRLSERVAALAGGATASKIRSAAPLWSDPLTAAITGIRSALAVVIAAAFWVFTAWPNGPIAVIVAGVASTLLAPEQRPEKVTTTAAATVLLFAVPLFVTQFCLLPYAQDIFSMAALLGPYLFACAFIIAQPGIGPLGLLSAVYLAVSSHIDNNSAGTYDALAFFNTTLAIVLGFGISVVLYATFFPETPQWAARRFFRLVCANLSRLASARNAAFSSFDFALCENLSATLARLKEEPALAQDCLLGGEIALSSSWAIERVKTGIVECRKRGLTFDPSAKLLAGLSRVYRSPSRAGLTRSAWEGRATSRNLLAAASAAGKLADRVAFRDLAIGCEALRSNVMKMRMLLIGLQHVHRS